MLLGILINALIGVVTLIVCWKAQKRYFTTLSNLFSALVALLLMALEIGLMAKGGGMADLPRWAVVLKYVATVSVAVTFLTVMVFLGPIYGYKSQLEGTGAWVHAAGPILAILVFGLLEKGIRLSAGEALLGLLPTLIYGIYYLYMVIVKTEKKGGWEDFYAFNRGGKWPISFSAMVLGTGLICLLLSLLHNA